MLDVLIAPLIFSMCVLFILALMYRRAPEHAFYIFSKKKALPVLAAMLVTCTVGAFYVLRGAPQLGEGFQAAKTGDWATAQGEICRAASSNREKTFYAFQCSLASAFVSIESKDPEALQIAVDMQRQALEKDPYWYMHWANLASYEWQLGEYQLALEHMRKVVEMAPNRLVFLLNLGWMEEYLGQDTEALEHYRIVICLDPGLRYRDFFDQTALRREALHGDCPPEYDTLANSEYQRAFWDGIAALRAGELESAERHLQRAIQLNPHGSLSYAYLGETRQMSGRSEAAWRDVQTALYINDKSAANYLIAAQIARAQGKDSQAVEYISKAYDLIMTSNYSLDYYVRTYRYIGLPTDFSPYIFRTSLSAKTQDAFLYLAKHLQENGETEKAQEIHRWMDMVLKMNE
jgi:tetratricopeptide (TPR) repeat protein